MRLSLDVYCSFLCDVEYFENSPTFHHSTPDPPLQTTKQKVTFWQKMPLTTAYYKIANLFTLVYMKGNK